MGSKGSNTTTTNQNQTYTANPAIQGSAGQALVQAQGAATTPFQQPVQPIAGFSPLQQQAFNQYQALQGIQTPFYNQAQNYFQQGASPITASDINQYYQPEVSGVMAQLANIYGQQQSQNNANLIQSAGGIGADRIAVGQAQLANQQNLAAGQTASNIYQQAAAQAQADKARQFQAASGIEGLGGASLQSALQGTGALFGAGQTQQTQAQNELNAPYQNTLARLAYPFQTAQYLAGITGGLAPALGGTTTGQQVTQAPQPSVLSQILGVGTAGVGLYGALNNGLGSGGFGGGNDYAANSANTLANNTGGAFYGPGFAEGGEVDSGDNASSSGGVTQDPWMRGIEANPQFIDELIGHRAGGGGIDDFEPIQISPEQNSNLNTRLRVNELIGSLDPKPMDTEEFLRNRTINQWFTPRRADGGEVEDNNPPGLHENSVVPVINLQPGAGHSGPLTGGMAFPQPQSTKSDSLGSEIGSALGVATKVIPFLKRGGAAYPRHADGNDVDDDNIINQLATQGRATSKPLIGPSTPTSNGIYDLLRANARPLPQPNTSMPPPPMGQQAPVPFPIQTDPFGSLPNTRPLPGPARRRVPVAATSGEEQAGAGSVPGGGDGLPTPNVGGNWGQNAAKSPWLSLVAAGATMASTPGPLGVSIGKGLLAGTKELETQQTAAQKQQTIDQKASELGETAKEHLRKWNKMTPYDREYLNYLNSKNNQSEAGSELDEKTQHKYMLEAARMHGQNIQVWKAQNASNITGNPLPPPSFDDAYQQVLRRHGHAAGAGAAAPATPTAAPKGTIDDPIPDPGGNYVKGLYYRTSKGIQQGT